MDHSLRSGDFKLKLTELTLPEFEFSFKEESQIAEEKSMEREVKNCSISLFLN